jgi:hypothetical protein
MKLGEVVRMKKLFLFIIIILISSCTIRRANFPSGSGAEKKDLIITPETDKRFVASETDSYCLALEEGEEDVAVLFEKLSGVPVDFEANKEIVTSYRDEHFSNFMGMYAMISDILILHGLNTEKTIKFLSSNSLLFTTQIPCKEVFKLITPCPDIEVEKQIKVLAELWNIYSLIMNGEEMTDIQRTEIEAVFTECVNSDEGFLSLFGLSGGSEQTYTTRQEKIIAQ